jgi:hypothetical protein
LLPLVSAIALVSLDEQIWLYCAVQPVHFQNSAVMIKGLENCNQKFLAEERKSPQSAGTHALRTNGLKERNKGCNYAAS